MKFPDHFSTKVDFSKVKMEAMMPWISTEVAKYLGFEDEVVIGYIESQLQQTQVEVQAVGPPFGRPSAMDQL